MAERNESHLLNGGDDSIGMTDNQYKGMLLDQLEDWQEILDLAVEAGTPKFRKKAEKQIAKINEKLKILSLNQRGGPAGNAGSSLFYF